MATLKIELNPITDEKVKSRPVSVVAEGGKSKTVECVKGDGTFDAQPGEHGYCLPLGDVNDKGTGPPGAQFSWSVPMDVVPPAPELPPADPELPPAAAIVAITQVKTPAKTSAAAHHSSHDKK